MAQKRKKRHIRKGALAALFVLAVLIAAGFGLWRYGQKPKSGKTEATPTPTPTLAPTPEPTLDPAVFSDPQSILLLANKKHPLPSGYEPDDLVPVTIPTSNAGVTMRLEANEAMTIMAEAARRDDVTLKVSSAFRGESYQHNLYSGYAASYGSAQADRISSRPGYSEHQTGLCADFVEGSGADFRPEFEDTASGKWLAAHAHEYGFILRYPKGKEEITGYAYEPWHFRYVGKQYAKEMYAQGADMTFEEFFHQEGGDYVSPSPSPEN